MTDATWPRVFTTDTRWLCVSSGMIDVNLSVVFPELYVTVEQLFATQYRGRTMQRGIVTHLSTWPTRMVTLLYMVP
jgi:hypothetical protein